jgi:hypothetical protein
VVELDSQRRAADPAPFDRPLAAAAVADPDGAPHVGGNVVALRRRRLLPRLRDEALALGVLGEDEVEAGLEDRLVPGAGMGLRERGPRRLELLHEAA